jgi:hypothetical protein
MSDTTCPFCQAEKYDNAIPETDMAGNPFPINDAFLCGSSAKFRAELCREREAHNKTKCERDEAMEALREAIQFRNTSMSGYDLEKWMKAAGLEGKKIR